MRARERACVQTWHTFLQRRGAVGGESLIAPTSPTTASLHPHTGRVIGTDGRVIAHVTNFGCKRRKEIFYLMTHSTHLRLYGGGHNLW